MKNVVKVFIHVYMYMLGILIFPFIFGNILLKKLDEAVLKEELRLLTVLSFFFLTPVVGILMVCLKDEHLIGNIDFDYNTMNVDREKEMLQRTDDTYKVGKLSNTKTKSVGGSRLPKNSVSTPSASGFPSSHSGVKGR